MYLGIGNLNMLPDNQIVSYVDHTKFLLPTRSNKLYDRAYGGVALNDSSQGLMIQIWKLYYENGWMKLMDSFGNIQNIISVNGIVTEVSLAFDQNMRVTIAYVVDGITKLYWFDSLANAMTTTTFTGYTNPLVSFDDGRTFAIPNSDIIFAYIRGGNVYWRNQRERYQTERFVRSAPVGSTLRQIGMTKGLRFTFELKPPRGYIS